MKRRTASSMATWMREPPSSVIEIASEIESPHAKLTVDERRGAEQAALFKLRDGLAGHHGVILA